MGIRIKIGMGNHFVLIIFRRSCREAFRQVRAPTASRSPLLEGGPHYTDRVICDRKLLAVSLTGAWHFFLIKHQIAPSPALPELPRDEFTFWLIFDLYDSTVLPSALLIARTSGRLGGEPLPFA